MPAISIVSGAGAFGRNHRGAQGMFRSALLAKGGAVVGLFDALENQTTDADGRFLGVDFLDAEDSLRVMVTEFPPQFVAAFRNVTHAAPFPVADFEDLVYELLSHSVALTLDHASVAVFHFRPALLKLANRHQDSMKQVQRFESSNDDRHLEARGDGLVFAIAHDCADVAWAQKALHAIERRL